MASRDGVPRQIQDCVVSLMAAEAWFTWDKEDGFNIHTTEQHAKEYAEWLIEKWRDHAREEGEWAEEVEDVCYGRITHMTHAQRVEYEGDNCETVDYELKAIS